MFGQKDAFKALEAELLRKHQRQLRELRQIHGIGHQKNTIHSAEHKSTTYSRLKLHEGFDISKHRIVCKGEKGASKGAPARFKPYETENLKTCCKKLNCHKYFSTDDIEAIRYRIHVPKPKSGEIEQRIDDVKLKATAIDDVAFDKGRLLVMIGAAASTKELPNTFAVSCICVLTSLSR